MTVNDSRLLKGVLTFGAIATGAVAAGQTTNCVIEQQDGDTEDVVNVLSGETVGGETTSGAWHITATLIQDFSATPSIQQWSYLNKDTEQDFTFTPNDQVGTVPTITGRVNVKFIGLGGDVKTRITRDIDWGIVGEPDFGTWGEPEALTADADAEPEAAEV